MLEEAVTRQYLHTEVLWQASLKLSKQHFCSQLVPPLIPETQECNHKKVV